MTRQLLTSWLLAIAFFAAACTASPPAATRPTASPTKGAAPTAAVASPSPSNQEVPLAVDSVGASASASGFIAFALISNPSSRAAADVSIQIAAVNASGAELTHGAATISRIDPSTTQAVAVRLPATPATPSSFKASLGGNRWLDPSSAVEPVVVLDASFAQDPRTPTVRVRVANHATAQERVAVTAVCLDAAGAVRGGGTAAVTVSASNAGQDVWVPVSIPVVPASCKGYALAE